METYLRLMFLMFATGLGYGALVVGLALLFLLTSGAAMRGACRGDAFERKIGRRLTERGRDSCDVKPGGIGHGPAPINVARLSECDGAVIAIVDHLGRSLIRPRLDKVNPQPSFGADHL